MIFHSIITFYQIKNTPFTVFIITFHVQFYIEAGDWSKQHKNTLIQIFLSLFINFFWLLMVLDKFNDPCEYDYNETVRWTYWIASHL